jgi:phosphotriesterase-related protein
MNSIGRRQFIKRTGVLAAGAFILPNFHASQEPYIMTIAGPVPLSEMGFTLPHEHVMTDFIGADKVSADRYNQQEVFNTALPFLKTVKEKGCNTFIECTPAYIGRDVLLLRFLAEETGMSIITNTGYYGAAKEKFIPKHAYKESADELAGRWIDEANHGIDETGIKPGFIKTGVDQFPLSEVQKKLIHAAAITHRSTGLTIGVHTGDGAAAMEELKIIRENGIDPSAWIWIHAQSEKNRQMHIDAAKAGGWVEFDSVNKNSIEQHLNFLLDMKKAGVLNRALISHDSGWYHVGEQNGGTYNDYNTIFTDFLPAMRKAGFTDAEIDLVFRKNPGEAFAVRIRRR